MILIVQSTVDRPSKFAVTIADWSTVCTRRNNADISKRAGGRDGDGDDFALRRSAADDNAFACERADAYRSTIDGDGVRAVW